MALLGATIAKRGPTCADRRQGPTHDHQMVQGCDAITDHEAMVTKQTIKIRKEDRGVSESDDHKLAAMPTGVLLAWYDPKHLRCHPSSRD